MLGSIAIQRDAQRARCDSLIGRCDSALVPLAVVAAAAAGWHRRPPWHPAAPSQSGRIAIAALASCSDTRSHRGCTPLEQCGQPLPGERAATDYMELSFARQLLALRKSEEREHVRLGFGLWAVAAVQEDTHVSWA